MRHIYWITSNGTGTWNFTLMFGCVLHFTVSNYNWIPFSWMLILQISWYFCSWGIVPRCGSPPERPPIVSLHQLMCCYPSRFLLWGYPHASASPSIQLSRTIHLHCLASRAAVRLARRQRWNVWESWIEGVALTRGCLHTPNPSASSAIKTFQNQCNFGNLRAFGRKIHVP